MTEQRTITILTKETDFGYTEEIRFYQNNFSQGGKEYYIKGYEIWEDGHRTEMENLRYLKVNKEYGNNLYKRYIQEGYKKTDSYSFQPTQMDMR